MYLQYRYKEMFNCSLAGNTSILFTKATSAIFNQMVLFDKRIINKYFEVY